METPLRLWRLSAPLRTSLRTRRLCKASGSALETSGGGGRGRELQESARDDRVSKVWGSNLELPAVTKEAAQDAFEEATDLSRAITPPTAMANEARKDMVNNRFDYVEKNLNPNNQFVVMGKDGKTVAPAAVSQGSLLAASAIVLMGAIASVVYLKQEWGVTSGKDLGDKLRARGGARSEMLETTSAARLVRTLSQTAERTVTSNVDLVRRPSQHLGETFKSTFQGGVLKGGAAKSTHGTTGSSTPTSTK